VDADELGAESVDDLERVAHLEEPPCPRLAAPRLATTSSGSDGALDQEAQFFARLTERLRVVRYDRVGVGLSDRARDAFTLESEVDSLSALVWDFGLESGYPLHRAVVWQRLLACGERCVRSQGNFGLRDSAQLRLLVFGHRPRRCGRQPAVGHERQLQCAHVVQRRDLSCLRGRVVSRRECCVDHLSLTTRRVSCSCSTNRLMSSGYGLVASACRLLWRDVCAALTERTSLDRGAAGE